MPSKTICEMCGESFNHVAEYVVHQMESHTHEEMIETYYLKPMQQKGEDDGPIHDRSN